MKEKKKKKENIVFLKNYIVCLEESIVYIEKHLQELNEKLINLLTHRFETHNDISLKNLEDKKNSNKLILNTLKLESQEIKEMYEKRIEMKELEIRMISENYKKRLYEKFNSKVSKDFQEVENNRNSKKHKNLEAEELKMKIIDHETKIKRNKKKGGKKDNFEDFNSKFYHLRK